MRPGDAARLIVLSAIWGSSYLLIKVALEELTPAEIVAGRLVLGAVVLVGILRARGRRLPVRALWGRLAVMAVVANVIPFGLISWGETEVASGMASILNSTTPLFTAPLAAVILHDEEFTPLRGGGVVLGFAGVVLIIGMEERGSLLGGLAIVAAAASYACGFVYARRYVANRPEGPLQLSAGQLAIGALIALPLATYDLARDVPSVEMSHLASVVVLGTLGTGIAYLLYYRLVAEIGATNTPFVTYLIPLFGVSLGFAILGERVGWNTAAGAVLVITGIGLAQRARPRPDRPPSSETPAAGRTSAPLRQSGDGGKRK